MEIGWTATGLSHRPSRLKQGIESQIRLQAQASDRLHEQRLRAGSLDFETIEAQPVMNDGKVVDLHVPRKNPASAIIENFMVSANATMATYLEARGVPAIQRVVRSPERWPRIVELASRLHEQLPAEADPVALSKFLVKRRLRRSDALSRSFTLNCEAAGTWRV